MIDIVKFKEKPFELGFKKVYNISEFKIVEGGKSLEDNRKLIERKMSIFLSPEKNINKNSVKFLDTGLNHVICKIATDRIIAIGISFSSLLNSENVSLTLTKLRYNIKLCKKYKTKIIIGSFAENMFEMRSMKDLMAFGRVIGLNEKEAKEALNFTK